MNVANLQLNVFVYLINTKSEHNTIGYQNIIVKALHTNPVALWGKYCDRRESAYINLQFMAQKYLCMVEALHWTLNYVTAA
jgi:hypothetical protein